MIDAKSMSYLNKARLLQIAYPNLGNGFSKNLTLREIAEKIKSYEPNELDENYKLKKIFKRYSTNTLIHFIRGALSGCKYEDEILYGLMEDDYQDVYIRRKQIRLKKSLEKKIGYVPWDDEEENWLIKEYNKGSPLRVIFEKYQHDSQFKDKNRTYESIENKLAELRKRKKIGNQKINWYGDIGFFALALLERYGKKGNFLVENSKSLDEYFYDGKGVITKQKLNNFYRREEKK
jgi:hypothetical protein